MRLLATTVVRGAHRGQRHGALWEVDLDAGEAREAYVHRELGAAFEGRGGDRGLRGIAVAGGRVFVAAAARVLVFDAALGLEGDSACAGLGRLHALMHHGGYVYAVSTAFDAVLAMNAASGAWVWGVWLEAADGAVRARVFDPRTWTPPTGGAAHWNHVAPLEDGSGFVVSGLRSTQVLAVRGDTVEVVAAVPAGTHDVRPWRGGLLMHDTAADRVLWRRAGRGDVAVPIPTPGAGDVDALELSDALMARPRFGRGLVPLGGARVAGGWSPARVTTYDLDAGAALDTVVLSRDVRDAVHGLAVWPG